MTVSQSSQITTDQAALRTFGQQVRERLQANPQVWKVPTDQAEIYAAADFLSAEECARMIDMIDEVARPSQVFDMDYADGFRTSSSGNFDPFDPFIKLISRRIDQLLGVDQSCGETIQGQRYLPGQEFKPHQDWFHAGTSYWDTEMARGGQRSYTAMAFLNEVESGGTTDFIDLGLSIEPKPGVLLLWNNADMDGIPNLKTLHAGRPVARGSKYIITKWYRTRKWC